MTLFVCATQGSDLHERLQAQKFGLAAGLDIVRGSMHAVDQRSQS